MEKLEIKNGRLIKCNDKSENIIIPNNVISIEIFAFCHCTSLESITIPDSVTSIGSDAFHGCIGLKK